MDAEARDTMHMCKEALQKTQKGLEDASEQVENTTMKNEIIAQIDDVSKCLKGCEKICSGLSQYKTEKKFQGIHH